MKIRPTVASGSAIAEGPPAPPRPAQSLAAALLETVKAAPFGCFVFIKAKGELKLSFAQMLQSAQTIRAALEGRGARRGGVVLIYADRPEQVVQGLWACILGGFAALPVAPRARDDLIGGPFRAIARLPAEERPFALVSDREGAARLGRAGLTAAAPVVLDHVVDAAIPDRPPARASPDDIRLLIRSSGTTGEPNLVALSERALLERWWPALPSSEQAAVFLSWTPLDHVMGLALASPSLPIRIHLATELFIERPTAWLDVIHQRRVTHATMTGFGMALLVKQDLARFAGRWDLSCVRRIGVGAEAVQPAAGRTFAAALEGFGMEPGTALQGYGLTECGPVASGPCGDAMSGMGAITPGHAARIVDEGDVVLQEGEHGAVQVRGPSMASGYFRDAAATAGLLTADGWIRTGDHGALSNGRLTILGRTKEILVINARKHPCRAVEEAAEADAGVERAYVAPLDDADDAKAGFGLFYVPAGANPPDPDLPARLRRRLARRFGAPPAFALPIRDDQLPRTALGKVRRLALAEAARRGDFAEALRQQDDRGRQARTVNGVAPSTGLEAEVAAIFREVLGVDEVFRSDDFFELGGDSLGAVRLIAALERRFGGALDIDSLVDGGASVAEIARRLETPAPSPSAAAQGRGRQDGIATTLGRLRALLPELPALGLRPALPRDLERKLLAETAGWGGVRRSPGSLMFGRNPAGSKTPLFWCLHSDGDLDRLAAALGPDQPIFGLRSGARTTPAGPKIMAALAARHAREIIQAQRDGPYWIGGFCQGAYLAAAISAELARRGGETRLLSLLDALPPDVFPQAPYSGRAAIYAGVHSRFNPYRRFRRPDLGWRKIFPAGLRFTLLSCGHLDFCKEPALSRFAAALSGDAAWAFGEPSAGGSDQAFDPWPSVRSSARIHLVERVRFQAGAPFSIKTAIVNLGPTAWRPTDVSGVALGDHWLDERGEVVVWSDGWTSLTETVAPGETVHLTLSGRAPAAPGRYWLELDMVEEGVAWFRDRRSRTNVFDVLVRA